MQRLFEGAYSRKYDILILVGWNCPSLKFSMLHFFLLWMSFVYAFCWPTLSTGVYRISSSKCPGAYFKFQLKRWAFVGRRALNREERLLRFPLNKLEDDLVVPGKFTAFTKSTAIGKTLEEEITRLSKWELTWYCGLRSVLALIWGRELI